jgi:hypothetical protein
MVFAALGGWMLGFSAWVVSGLPAGSSWTLPTGWLATAQAYMGFVGLVVDLHALQTAISIMASFYLATFALRVIIWAWHVIRP